MIRVSKLTDYGVVLLSKMARTDPEQVYNARFLSTETRIPLPMVSKILKRLARQGLLNSHRGTKGGYSLARSPDDLTLVDMITALEGPIAMTQCVSLSDNSCDKIDHCPMCSGWEIVNNVIVNALGSMTLSSMCIAFERPSAFDGAALVQSALEGTISFSHNGDNAEDRDSSKGDVAELLSPSSIDDASV